MRNCKSLFDRKISSVGKEKCCDMRFQTRRDIQYITYFTLLLVTLHSCIKARNGKLNVDNYSLYFLLWLVKDFDKYIYIYFYATFSYEINIHLAKMSFERQHLTQRVFPVCYCCHMAHWFMHNHDLYSLFIILNQANKSFLMFFNADFAWIHVI